VQCSKRQGPLNHEKNLLPARRNQAGATIAISESLEASLQPGAAVLDTTGLPEEDSATLIESFRRENYE
jgi:hypothetical protein